jgi:uncharacterized protein (UPF0332 family)
MSNFKEDYIQYRIEKCKEAFEDALLLTEQKRWNASVNRLYYSCYYIVSALLLKNNIDTKTHSGLKNQLNLHFVKPGLLSLESGRLYSDLIDSRQKGDYGDLFDFDEETVLNLIPLTRAFINEVEKLLSP